jgi:hypothetical protein
MSASPSASPSSGPTSQIKIGEYFQNLGTTDLLDGSFLTAKRAVLGPSAILAENDTFEIMSDYSFSYIGTGSYYRTRIDANPITLNTISPISGGGLLSEDRTLSVGGLTGIGSSNNVVAVNAAGNSWAYKSIIGSTGVTVTHTDSQITIASDGTTPVTDHDLLSSSHPDTITGSPVRGDLITAQEETVKWKKLALGTNGYFIKSNGTDIVWAAHGLTYSDVGAQAADADLTAIAGISIARGMMITAQGASPAWAGMAISVPTTGLINYVGVAYGDVEPGYKALFDATVPSTITENDTALAGSASTAARRDHVHAAPETWKPTTHNLLSIYHYDTTGGTVSRGDLIAGIGSTPKWTKLALGTIGTIVSSDGTDVKYQSLSTLGIAPASAIAGTQYRIPRFATTSTLGDSNIYTDAAGTMVGIGVAASDAILKVYTAASGSNALRIGTSGSGGRAIDFGIGDGSTPASVPVSAGYILDNTSTGIFIGSATISNSYLYITPSAGIGVNTLSPLAKLQANGTIVTSDEELIANEDIFILQKWENDPVQRMQANFGLQKYETGSYGKTQLNISLWDTTSISSPLVSIRSNGRVGIGAPTPVSFVELRRASDDATHWFSLTCDGLTHGITTVLPTHAFFSIDTQDTSKGGATIMGATSEDDRNPVMLFGILGATDGLGQTVAAINIRGSKQNGTTITAITTTKPVIDFTNNNTLLGRFIGSGYFGFNTSAPDKQVEINSATGDCLRLTYNVDNGSATYYSDFSVSNAGQLSIVAAGGIYSNNFVGIGATPDSNVRLSLGSSSSWTTAGWLKSLYFNTNDSVMLWDKSSDNLYCGFGHTSNSFYWITSTAIDNSAVAGYPMSLTNAGDLTLGSIAHETTDVDKIIVSSSGQLKYRTGAEILSDIGGAGALSGTQYRIPRFATTSTLGDSNIYTDAAGTMVGIGVAASDAILKVYTAAAGSNALRVGTSGSGGRAIDFGIGDGSTPTSVPISAGYILDNTSTGIFIGSDSVSNSFVYITPSSGIGINTLSPLAKLQVNGTQVPSTHQLLANEDIFIIQRFENDPVQRMQANFGLQKYEDSDYGKTQLNVSLWDTTSISSPIVSIRGNGNVGVCGDPSYRFQVFGGSTSLALNYFLNFETIKYGFASATINYSYSGSTSWYLMNQEDNKALATMLNGGNFGIGTVTPLARVHIVQNIATARNQIMIDQSPGTGNDTLGYIGFNAYHNASGTLTHASSNGRGAFTIEHSAAAANSSLATFSLLSPTLTDEGYFSLFNKCFGINSPSPTHSFEVRNVATDSWLGIEMEIEDTDFRNANYYSISSTASDYTRHQFYTHDGFSETDHLAMFIDYDGSVEVRGPYLWVYNDWGTYSKVVLECGDTDITSSKYLGSFVVRSRDSSTYGIGECARIDVKAAADFGGSGRPTYFSFCTSDNNNSGPIERFKIGYTGILNYVSPVNEGTTASKILTLDSANNIDFRTPAELIVDMGGVSGTGTDNYLLKYTTGATGAVGDSNIVDNGSSLRLLSYTYIDSETTNNTPYGLTLSNKGVFTNDITTKYVNPFYIIADISISSGKTVTNGVNGAFAGAEIVVLRGYPDDNGSLDALTGLLIYHGHAYTYPGGSTATTTNSYGIRLRPYHNTTTSTIINSYGIKIESPNVADGEATVTNQYPIYSAWAAKSYLAGGLQVDGTITCATITHATSISLTSPKVYIGSRTMETDEGGRAILYTAGENLAKGEVVCFLQGGTGGRVYKCPTSGNSADMPIGIVYADATSGNSVWIVCSGRAEALPEAGLTLTMGYVCSVSTSTSGRVTQENTPSTVQHWRECGHPEANGSANGALTFINVHFN